MQDLEACRAQGRKLKKLVDRDGEAEYGNDHEYRDDRPAQFEERATEEGTGDAWWAQAYIAVGDYERALQRIESAVNERVSLDQTALFALAGNSWGDPELEEPEFRALLDGLWDDQ